MDDELTTTVAGCAAAHRRLEATLDIVDDDVARGPSVLPGWTVGHVLTHLARNAESHVRMLEAAGVGESVEQYPGGLAQRSHDIEAGAGRSARELRDDVRSSSADLEQAWASMTPEAWNGHGLAHGTVWPCRLLPFHRWREVEIHHVDLGLGYGPADWPDDYVARELPVTLLGLADRLTDPSERRAVLAWLVGRADQPGALDVEPWQPRRESYHLAPPGFGDDRRVVTVFRSRLRHNAIDAYGSVMARMAQLAQSMPGYLELKTFTADDGECVSLVTFASPEDQAAWRDHPEHREAQRRGRDEFYGEYLIQVCRVVSERSFRGRTSGVDE